MLLGGDKKALVILKAAFGNRIGCILSVLTESIDTLFQI